jgi:hypothetical protein
MSTWGAHYYVVGEQLIPIVRTIALCYGCNKIVSIEVLEFYESAIGVHSDGLESALWNKALKDRVSLVRCLNCGSHDYEIIPKNKISYPAPTHPIRTGLIHRNCGGRIYAEHNTPNLNFGHQYEPKYYNTEGEAIVYKKNINWLQVQILGLEK